MWKRIGIVGVILLLVVGAWYVVKPQHYETNSVEEYRNFAGHIQKEETDFFSGLEIFPQEISEKMTDITYYYECGNAHLDNNYLVYLECKWSEEAYSKEIERLSQISVSYEEEQHNIVFMEDAFSYPAYVTIYDADMQGAGTMEYALIQEKERKIIYIFYQLTNVEGKVPSEYLALNAQRMNDEVIADCFNIYLFQKDDLGIYVK